MTYAVDALMKRPAPKCDLGGALSVHHVTLDLPVPTTSTGDGRTQSEHAPTDGPCHGITKTTIIHAAGTDDETTFEAEDLDRGGKVKVRRPVDAGPPLPIVASITAALVVAGIVVPLLASGGQAYPSPLDGGQTLQSYVASHPEALQWAALFQFAASIPLAVLTASMVARLHALGVRAAGPMIALVGGGLASAAMALSACGQWMLSRMPADAPPSLLHAVHDLVFITGGPWQVVASGLLLAGVAVSAAFHRLLPRPVWISGVALAVVCELATLSFATTAAAYLLPVGRFARGVNLQRGQDHERSEAVSHSRRSH